MNFKFLANDSIKVFFLFAIIFTVVFISILITIIYLIKRYKITELKSKSKLQTKESQNINNLKTESITISQLQTKEPLNINYLKTASIAIPSILSLTILFMVNDGPDPCDLKSTIELQNSYLNESYINLL